MWWLPRVSKCRIFFFSFPRFKHCRKHEQDSSKRAGIGEASTLPPGGRHMQWWVSREKNCWCDAKKITAAFVPCPLWKNATWWRSIRPPSTTVLGPGEAGQSFGNPVGRGGGVMDAMKVFAAFCFRWMKVLAEDSCLFVATVRWLRKRRLCARWNGFKRFFCAAVVQSVDRALTGRRSTG